MERSWQIFGAALLLVALAVVIVLPQYADYRTRSETVAMLYFLKELQEKVEHKTAQRHSLSGIGEGISPALREGLSL